MLELEFPFPTEFYTSSKKNHTICKPLIRIKQGLTQLQSFCPEKSNMKLMTKEIQCILKTT